MLNQVNLNGILKSDDDYLAKDQALPQNTSANGNGGSFDLGNTEASLEVVAEVGSVAIDLSDAKVLTVMLQDSADNSSFADLGTVYTITASAGSGVKAVGTVLGRLLIPTTARRYVKAVITTDDADVNGKLNVYLVYIPR